MIYQVQIMYLDGKSLPFNLAETEVTNFLENVKKNSPIWTNNKESAFYVPLENIRYMNIVKLPEEATEEPTTEIVEE